jgi:hypothetical protein
MAVTHNDVCHCRYASTAKQETCLCKACENFTCYDKCFEDVMEILSTAMLHGCEDEAELPPDERDPLLTNAAFEALQKLAQIKRRIDKVPILSHSCLHSHTAACTLTQLPALSHSCLYYHTAVCTLTQLPALSHGCLYSHTAACTLKRLPVLSHGCLHSQTAVVLGKVLIVSRVFRHGQDGLRGPQRLPC